MTSGSSQRTGIKFLGQVIELSGNSADPDNVSAVWAMKEPCNVEQFLPHLNEKTQGSSAKTCRPGGLNSSKLFTSTDNSSWSDTV